MKKLDFILFVCSLSLTGMAHGQGIHFVKGLNWQQIIDKAKAEHKNIFVDCYTTWCGPCKMMEQSTYNDQQVGVVFNRDFISVKVQMDKTARDNDSTKSWYSVAEQFSRDYMITAFPSFLFFDGNGKALHKSIGYQEPADFTRLAAAAEDSSRQFYTLAAKYRQRRIEPAGIAYLADNAGILGDQSLGDSATLYYVQAYLDRLPDSALLSPENQAFARRHAAQILLDDKPFLISLHEPDGAFSFACFVIANRMVYPALVTADKQKTEPDWSAIEKNISARYGEKYVTDNDFLLDDQIGWYKYKKNGPQYAHFLVVKTGKIPTDSLTSQAAVYQANASDIFKYSHDQADLSAALSWMQRLDKLQTAPDAKTVGIEANILYKLNRKQEAIKLEKAAIAIKAEDDLQEDYKNMLTGKPTWPERME